MQNETFTTCQGDPLGTGTTSAHINFGSKMLGRLSLNGASEEGPGSMLETLPLLCPPSSGFAKSLPQGRVEKKEAEREREGSREAELAGRL